MLAGFQGEPGAFSEEAAQAYLPGAQTRGFLSFDALVEAVDSRVVDCGVLPCENSIYGPVTRAYDLLYAYPRVRITGETIYRVVQALIGVPGARIEDLRRIESHPVALEQCRTFLASFPKAEIVPVADTAGAVRAIALAADPTRAAIGPASAAQTYGGVVLAASVQDESENYTRFFAIERDGSSRAQLGRAVLAFVLAHRAGSLHEALGRFAQRGLNLRALVARPLPGRPFEYVFYAEIDCPQASTGSELVAELGEGARLIGWY